ncbi:MAG: pyridoxal phosphate-dependent aminotransferase [Rhodococcus sp. (in: high G+C Gram-positive bacteria)]|nr:MAG: pyridoxal phosphate-dependent aminotransferase [Rhodococcus sp. (in: high G+C Gram-positive bacteria)]
MLERLPALALSDRAQVRRRAGQEMVPMRGVPMLPMPPHVVDVVSRATPEVFPRDSRGSLIFKTAVAEHLREEFALAVNPDRELLVTHGAQHGLSVALRALLVPGDEVLIPAPSYFFDGTVRLAGAVPRYVPSVESDGWRLPLDQMEAAISPRTLSKNYAFTSWRVGYIHAKADLIDIIHAALEWDAINIGDIPQLAAAAAISGPQDWLDREFSTFRTRRDLLLEGVTAAGLTVVTPQAGIFAFVNFSPLGVTGVELEESLLDAGITALSGDRFFGPGSCARVLYGGTAPSLVQLGRQLKVLAHRVSA